MAINKHFSIAIFIFFVMIESVPALYTTADSDTYQEDEPWAEYITSGPSNYKASTCETCYNN